LVGIAGEGDAEDRGDCVAEGLNPTANSDLKETAFQMVENTLGNLLAVDDQASFV
jgi:hypothetical protein